jgi:pimeloyl-ACP methyl ester carboxylesterase
MTTVEVNGVTLGVEHFAEATAPLVLLAGGTTMLSWPDALCEALARGGRHVVRYDLRDCGASTTVGPEAPTYTLRDLAADAAALARELGDRPAHLAGIGVGGMVAQVAALDHPDAFSALTLVGTRPVAPGRVDDDLPDHDAPTIDRLFSRPMPDWSDRTAVGEYAVAGAEILGDDPATARATAERIWDRTPSTEPAVQMANQMGMVFAKLDCKPRWRERLSELAIPALVVHGRRDPFFPVGNAKRSHARSPVRGCSCWNRLRRRFPMRPPVKSRRRCSRFRRSRLVSDRPGDGGVASAFAPSDKRRPA